MTAARAASRALLQLAASKLQKEGGSQKNTKSAPPPPPPLGFAVGVAAECSCSVRMVPAAAQ